MDAYQDVCRNPCFRSISDHLSDLCIDLLGLGSDTRIEHANTIIFFPPNLTLKGLWSIGYSLVVI